MLPYDDILKGVIGEFGTYQKRCFFLLCLSAIPIGMWTVSPVFLHADTDHWCKVPESNVITSTCIAYNVSDDCPRFTKDLTIPKEKYQNGCTSEWKYSNCYGYDRNIAMENLLLGDFGFLNTSDVVECQHGWEYDATRTTVNQEFDLVCDNYHLNSISMSLHLAGAMLGYAIYGPISDRFGRKKSFIIAVSTLVVFAFLEIWAPSFTLFAIGRITAGSSRYGIYSQVIVLSELVPESPRWLISVGKMHEAEKMIRKIGRGNNVFVPDDIFTSKCVELRVDSATDKKEALMKKESIGSGLSVAADIFRFPNMRKKSLISSFASAAVCITYYGFMLNTKLGGNAYLNIALAGLMEIPAYFVAAFLIETRFGRRFTFFGASLLCSTTAIAATLFPKCGNLLWVRISFFMVGKFGVAITYGIVWTYMSELYPTTVRSIGVSITWVSGMSGATFAPQILLLSNLWEPLPMIAIAVLQLIAGILALFLPETRGKKLPETIEEGEAFGRKKPTKEKDCKRSNAVKPGQIIKISSMPMSKTKEDFI
ncbi:organic cation transporter protein-like [Glandiceps talaboti]